MMLAAIGATKAGRFLGIGTDEADGNWKLEVAWKGPLQRCHVATLDGPVPEFSCDK